jgi:hypothetical protein
VQFAQSETYRTECWDTNKEEKKRKKDAFCKEKIKLSTRESLGYLGKTAVFPFFTDTIIVLPPKVFVNYKTFLFFL